MTVSQKSVMKIKLVLNAITIEPLLICYVAARAMCDPTLKNLELDKACYVKANYNGTVCNTITNGTFEEQNFTKENNEIQLHITDMHSWQISASSVITMFVVLVLGTISDHYKIRKRFLIFSVTGQLVELSGCIVCVAYMNYCPLEALGVAQEVVLSLFGGEKFFLTIIFAYITDITTEGRRTLRIAIIQGIYNICYGIGNLFTGSFLSKLGYLIVLSICFAVTMLGLVYAIFFVKESSVKCKKSDEPAITPITPKDFLETLKLFSKYHKSQSVKIIMILIVLALASTISYGELSVMFLFTATAYSWTIKAYTYFFTITTAINTLGLVCAVPLFTEVFKLHDLLIIAAAFLNRIIVNTIYVTVRTPLGLYIGCSIAILRILTLVGIRSQLTKYVHHYDICKVLALYTIVDSCSEAFASALYNKGIYGLTQATFPHAFFLVGIALGAIGILIVLLMYHNVRKPRRKDAKDPPVIIDAFDRRVSLDMQITTL
uniref:Major facilitator superfamily (MFS) profile domain-containing protein n=1 Tax=Photinus pyralis TaxID=7054 RepID=A0A1Y1NFG4_PHOPY